MRPDQFDTYDKQQILNAYKAIFNTNDGEIVLEDLKRAHYYYTSTATQPLDALNMAMAEGERNTVLRILTLLEYN